MSAVMKNTVIDEETGEVLSASGGELTVSDRAVLAFKVNDNALKALASFSKELTVINTEEDYKEVKTAEGVLVGRRLDITTMGKSIRDDANKFAKAVIAEENRLIEFIEPEEKRLKALRHVWDEAIRIEKGREVAEAEAKRLAALTLAKSVETGLLFGDNLITIQSRIAAVEAVDLDMILGEPKGAEATIAKQTLQLKQIESLNILRAAEVSAIAAEEASKANIELQRVYVEKAAEDAKAKSAESDRLRLLANAPDAEKLGEWLRFMRNSTALPVMTSEQGQQTKLDIIAELNALLVRVEMAVKCMS